MYVYICICVYMHMCVYIYSQIIRQAFHQTCQRLTTGFAKAVKEQAKSFRSLALDVQSKRSSLAIRRWLGLLVRGCVWWLDRCLWLAVKVNVGRRWCCEREFAVLLWKRGREGGFFFFFFLLKGKKNFIYLFIEREREREQEKILNLNNVDK